MKPLAATVPARFAELVGAPNILIDEAALSACEVDGVRPSAVVRPGTPEEIAEILRIAAADKLAVIPMGGRTKLAIGMPPRRYDIALDLTRMNRVLAFEPGDLTLGVEPGITFADLERHLAASRQFLPLAPTFAERATIGGMVASAADSPLRQGYGSLRDHLLGMEFVTGAGVASKSGGRVVKNVTGYDIHQLLAGSLGTLAVIIRVNFKTLPLPSEERIFLAGFRSHASSLDFCAAIARSQLQPRMVEVASGLAAGIMGSSHLNAGCWNVAVGGAGNRAVVLRHQRDLSRMAREHGASDFVTLDGAQRDDVFGRVCEFPRLVLEMHPHAAIFRIAILPGSMPELIDKVLSIAESRGVEAAILVRAVGVVYAALWPRQNTESLQFAAACRALMQAAIQMGAHPMIEFCPAALKSEVNVWPPLGSEESLVRKLKNVFDPHGVLAPGRFQGGL